MSRIVKCPTCGERALEVRLAGAVMPIYLHQPTLEASDVCNIPYCCLPADREIAARYVNGMMRMIAIALGREVQDTIHEQVDPEVDRRFAEIVAHYDEEVPS